MAAGDGSSQRTRVPDEMLLPDEFIERPWTHPGGQRLSLWWGSKERLRSRTGQAGRRSFGGHAVESTRRPRGSEEGHASDVHDQPEDGEDPEHDDRGEADSPNVAGNVGILVGRPYRER